MEIASVADLDRLLEKHRLVVIDYHASWCGPCKAYSPKFNRLDREMRRAVPQGSFAFVSADIDRARDLAALARVKSVPTTVGFRMGRSLFGRPTRKEVLRFSGDRPWNDLVRSFADALSRLAT